MFQRAYAACDAERNVDGLRHAPDPFWFNRATGRAGADVVEDQLVRALFGITSRQFFDAAHILVVLEPDALHNTAVTHIKARNDPTR